MATEEELNAAEAADAFNEDPEYMSAFEHLERKEAERKRRAFMEASGAKAAEIEADTFNDDPEYMDAFAHLEKKEQERRQRAFRQAGTSLSALEERENKRKSREFQKVKRLSMLAQREKARFQLAWDDVQREQEERWKEKGGQVLEAQGKGAEIDEEEEKKQKEEAEKRYLAKKARMEEQAAQLQEELKKAEAEGGSSGADGAAPPKLQRMDSMRASAAAQEIVHAAATAGGADGEAIKSETNQDQQYGDEGWDDAGVGKYGQATSPEDWFEATGELDEDEVDSFKYLELLEEARRKALFDGIRAEQEAQRAEQKSDVRAQLEQMLKSTIGMCSDALVRGLLRQSELEEGDVADDPMKYSHEQWNKFWFRNPNQEINAEKEVIGSTLGKIQFEKLKEKIKLDMLRKTNQTSVGDRLKFFKQAEKAGQKKNILWSKKGVQIKDK